MTEQKGSIDRRKLLGGVIATAAAIAVGVSAVRHSEGSSSQQKIDEVKNLDRGEARKLLRDACCAFFPDSVVDTFLLDKLIPDLQELSVEEVVFPPVHVDGEPTVLKGYSLKSGVTFGKGVINGENTSRDIYGFSANIDTVKLENNVLNFLQGPRVNDAPKVKLGEVSYMTFLPDLIPVGEGVTYQEGPIMQPNDKIGGDDYMRVVGRRPNGADIMAEILVGGRFRATAIMLPTASA